MTGERGKTVLRARLREEEERGPLTPEGSPGQSPERHGHFFYVRSS